MVISHNLLAMNAQRQYGITRNSRAKSTEKLSSGYRINRAADDAAGLAISEKMRRQIRGLNQGAENIQDGISLVQVADGALSEVHDMLNRMTELSVKAANGTLTTDDRSYIQSEITGIISEIQRIADTTTFNEINIFNDPEYYDQIDQSITKLLSCTSADKQYLSEAYLSPTNNKYYPAAYVNFSGVNSGNISKLEGGGFSFNCSQSCGEVFDIKFTLDSSKESATNLGSGQHHYYVVDISQCSNGSDVVNKIYTYVSNHLPASASSTSELKEGVKVSHSNNLIASGNSIIVARNWTGFSSNSDALSAYPRAGYPNSGKIFCTTIEAEQHDDFRDFVIQCSSNVDDIEPIIIYRMNTDKLGISLLDVTSEATASMSINTIKTASAKVSFQRSHLGAEQNRLEHSLAINRNVSENTSVAESTIRDTDMAKEIMRNSMLNILEQAGVSMMAQANQASQTVLSLLQ